MDRGWFQFAKILKTERDMTFNIGEFLRQNAFEQTRDGDRRDIFEKPYYHPFYNSNYNVRVTVFYDGGYTKWSSLSIRQMTIELTKNMNTAEDAEHLLYYGVAPESFDFALDLFRHIVPNQRFIENYK